MDTQTHAQGRAKNPTRKGTRKANALLNQVAGSLENVEQPAQKLVDSGTALIGQASAGGWVARNPKKAVGVALGAGLLIGSLIEGKSLRSAAAGAIGLLAKRYF